MKRVNLNYSEMQTRQMGSDEQLPPAMERTKPNRAQAGMGRAPGIAWYLRKGVQLPPELRAEIAGEQLAVQIALLVKDWWRYVGRPASTNAKDAREIKHYLRLYEQLAKAGCKLTDALDFREKHARLLLAYWRECCSPATIHLYWSRVLTLTHVLGKAGMVGHLEQYWPDAPPAKTAKRGARTQDATLNDDQLTELMRKRDLTHWFVQRLHQELGLSFAEAMKFDRGAAADRLHRRVIVDDRFRRREVRLQDETQVALVQQVVDFLTKTGRRELKWPVIGLDKAVRKHENRVAYLRRKDKAQQVDGSVRGDSSEGNHAA